MTGEGKINVCVCFSGKNEGKKGEKKAVSKFNERQVTRRKVNIIKKCKIWKRKMAKCE